MNATDVGTLETKLQKLGAKLDALVAKADEAGDDAELSFREGVKELKAKHSAARAKLDAMKKASGKDWETMKKGVEGAWHELEAALDKVGS